MKNDERTIKMTVAREIWNDSPADGRVSLERLLGKSELTGLPLGVWCLATDGTRTTAKDWDKSKEAQAVLVVTEKTSFLVSLHPSVALQWGCPGKAKSPLLRDKESFDSKAATDAMIKAYEGVTYEDKDGKIWNVEGSPAARWAREYSHGNIGAGKWNVPTFAQVEIIQKFRHEINDCLTAMGGYKLPATYHYSSIEHDEDRALCVSMCSGSVNDYAESTSNSVRAVSAFPFHFE